MLHKWAAASKSDDPYTGTYPRADSASQLNALFRHVDQTMDQPPQEQPRQDLDPAPAPVIQQDDRGN